MEREVLNSPQLLKILDGGFVAVKVCLDKVANSKGQARFDVDSMPTDVIVSPDGKVLARTEGYVSGQKYLTNLSRIDAKYAAAGKRLARSDATADEKIKQDRQAQIAKDSATAKPN